MSGTQDIVIAAGAESMTRVRMGSNYTLHARRDWTMTCGSGHIVADIISGRRPAIEAGDLALNRY